MSIFRTFKKHKGRYVAYSKCAEYFFRNPFIDSFGKYFKWIPSIIFIFGLYYWLINSYNFMLLPISATMFDNQKMVGWAYFRVRSALSEISITTTFKAATFWLFANCIWFIWFSSFKVGALLCSYWYNGVC